MSGEGSTSGQIGQAGFTQAALKAAGAKTEESQKELESEWAELQKVIALQDAYETSIWPKRAKQ